MASKVCPWCGAAFEGSGPRKYCSKKCSDGAYRHHHLDLANEENRRHRAKRRAERTVEKVCPNCGVSFATHNENKAYCSPACQKAYKLLRLRKATAAKNAIEKTCAWCGTVFTGNEKKKYCSDTCCDAAYRARHKRTLTESAVCPTCGETFERNRKDKKFCSDACRLASRNVRRRVEPKKEGAITDAQRRQVEEDMQIVYPAVRYRRSLAWTPAMHSYARRIYMESHPLRAGNCTVNH